MRKTTAKNVYIHMLGVNMKTTNWATRSELGHIAIHVEAFSSVLSHA